MNTMAWLVVCSIVFSIAFVLGAGWSYIGMINKSFEEGFAKELKDNQFNICDRCGCRYEIATSEDENVCQTCVAYLREDPDDEYFKTGG
jgi:hypothetical protein